MHWKHVALIQEHKPVVKSVYSNGNQIVCRGWRQFSAVRSAGIWGRLLKCEGVYFDWISDKTWAFGSQTELQREFTGANISFLFSKTTVTGVFSFLSKHFLNLTLLMCVYVLCGIFLSSADWSLIHFRAQSKRKKNAVLNQISWLWNDELWDNKFKILLHNW